MATTPGFEPLPSARFSVEAIDGAEWIVARPPRNGAILLLLVCFLPLWMIGGGALFVSWATSLGDIAFAIVWLAVWAFVLIYYSATVVWQFAGRSLVSVQEGQLVCRWTMPLAGKTSRYDVDQIRRLRAAQPKWPFATKGGGPSRSPPLLTDLGGSVQFDYGARTVRVLPGLDEAEGRMVADWLAKRLPPGAVAGV